MDRPLPPLEGYRIEGFLRSGRFGDLWTATRDADGKRVAVKLLKPELFKDGEAIRRFHREVELLLSFEHPYLLRVLGRGRTATGDPFVVLEHLEGRLLSDDVAGGPLPVARVREIGAQIARVLAAAAHHGIVHRGLCPEAILLVAGPKGDQVKVLDFGLVHVASGGDEPRLTELGQRLGDPTYMAPEYIEDFQFDARTDLYALGVVLYELLTGDPPFQGRAMQVLDAHVDQAPEPVSGRRAEVPAWLDALVLALLEKDPAARPQSGADVARGLIAGQWPPPEA